MNKKTIADIVKEGQDKLLTADELKQATWENIGSFYNTTGIEPNVIFMGQLQWRSYEYLEEYRYSNVGDFGLFGIRIERVLRPNYLKVTWVTE